jgi:hypothetical protein
MATAKINQLIEVEHKHPGTRRAYTINLASSDGTNDGSADDSGFLQTRTISSISVDMPAVLTLEASANDTTTFTLDISGGTADTRPEIDVLVTLSSAEIENVTIIVPITDVGSD